MIVPIAAAAWGAPERAALGWRDHMLTMLFGTWLMVGLFVDGWAHSNLEQLESFFTPWHALFYSGFGATAFWIAWCVRREGALPRGYAPAVLGVFAFGAGGVGDLIWHTLFGIEKDVEALLSPTHLLLFASMLAILASPLRAAWSAPGESAPSFRAFLPALLSLTLVTMLCLFFLMYLTPFNSFDTLAGRGDYIAHLPSEQEIDVVVHELSVKAGLAGFYATTAALLAPLLLVLRRWRPPFGAATLLFTVVVAFVSALEEFRLAPLIVPAAVAGLAADGLIRRLRPSPERADAYRLFAGLVPGLRWTGYFATVAIVWGTWWSVNLIGGAVVMSSLAGAGLAALMAPPARPGSDLAGRQVNG
jgi:hypothetical protein